MRYITISECTFYLIFVDPLSETLLLSWFVPARREDDVYCILVFLKLCKDLEGI